MQHPCKIEETGLHILGLNWPKLYSQFLIHLLDTLEIRTLPFQINVFNFYFLHKFHAEIKAKMDLLSKSNFWVILYVNVKMWNQRMLKKLFSGRGDGGRERWWQYQHNLHRWRTCRWGIKKTKTKIWKILNTKL